MDLIACRRLAVSLMEEHGLTWRGWTFEFDNASARGGVCRYRTKTISLSRKLVPMWSESEVRDTVLHEIAHALVGPGNGHGPVWRRQARAIGCTGQRTHDSETAPAPYALRCPTHGEVAKRYRRTGTPYLCAKCRTELSWVDKRAVLV